MHCYRVRRLFKLFLSSLFTFPLNSQVRGFTLDDLVNKPWPHMFISVSPPVRPVIFNSLAVKAGSLNISTFSYVYLWSSRVINLLSLSLTLSAYQILMQKRRPLHGRVSTYEEDR